MENLLRELAEINISGAPFLFTYGLTWTVCGILWKKLPAPAAAAATLFQGIFALPAALFIMYRIGAFAARPAMGEISSLVIIVNMSQLLALPLLIAMFRRGHYYLIPYIFSMAAAVHFLMYTWLYQTAAYIIMPAGIALVLSRIYFLDSETNGLSSSGSSKACLVTGGVLFATGICLSILHII